MSEISKAVDEFIILKQAEAELKEQISHYKSFFELQAEKDLHNKKSKTIKYVGSDNAFVKISNAQTIKLSEPELLENLFGSGLVTEKNVYELAPKYKKTLGLVVNNDMINGTLDELISTITTDSDTKALLKKKLKGDYNKDLTTLIHILNINEEEASDIAYLASEVMAFESFTKMLKSLNYTESKDDALNVIKSAIDISESYKITCSM